MNDKQQKVFEEVALQCVLSSYSRINVASKKRRDAIVAAYEHIDDLHTALQAALLPLEAAVDALVPPGRRVEEAAALVDEALVAIREEIE